MYVLGTHFRSYTDVPICKIGFTLRDPKERAREISLGSLSPVELIGYVPSLVPRELERAAHQKFASQRFNGGGGTEYFCVAPEEVIAWLKSEAPSVQLEVNLKDALKALSRSAQYSRARGLRDTINFLYWGLATIAAVYFDSLGALVLALILYAIFVSPLRDRWVAFAHRASLREAREQMEAHFSLPTGSLVPFQKSTVDLSFR